MNKTKLQGNYAISGGVKGIEVVEAKVKSFKARMTGSVPRLIGAAIFMKILIVPFNCKI